MRRRSLGLQPVTARLALEASVVNFLLVIEGDSYRNPPPTRRKKAQAALAEAAR